MMRVQGRDMRPSDSGSPGLGVVASAQCRLRPLEEPPSTYLKFPEFQLQLWLLLQAKEPLWSEGPLEPRPEGSLPLPAHTPPFSQGPAPQGGWGPGQPPPHQWGASWLGSWVDKTRIPLAPQLCWLSEPPGP